MLFFIQLVKLARWKPIGSPPKKVHRHGNVPPLLNKSREHYEDINTSESPDCRSSYDEERYMDNPIVIAYGDMLLKYFPHPKPVVPIDEFNDASDENSSVDKTESSDLPFEMKFRRRFERIFKDEENNSSAISGVRFDFSESSSDSNSD